jgi:selenide,water dikinase
VLSDIPQQDDQRILVDFRTADDAGVYRLDGTALVQTVDFFTPIVDDPFVYGQIAAANALSDVYAMGGRPLTALAIAGFPKQELDRGVLKAIFAGGFDKLREAGVALLGGHTVQDAEVKFGYAVTGVVDPDRVWSNAGARPGDLLILTKPIGTGVIATAIKFQRVDPAAASDAIESMRMLNRAAAAVLADVGAARVHACTDITGFGLIGHASEVAAASDVTLRLQASTVPLFEGARALALRNRPAGSATNEAYFGDKVEMAPTVDPVLASLLYDPQTSGGLLACVAAEAAPGLVAAFDAAGVRTAVVGVVEARGGPPVLVTA